MTKIPMFLLRTLFLPLILYSRLFAYQQISSPVIASIGDKYSVNFSDLKNFVYENFYHKFYMKEKSKGYLHALEQIINRRLKAIDFFETGLHKNKNLIAKLNRIINEELYNEYYEKFYSNKYLTDANIKKAYQRMGKIVYYQQILLNKGIDLKNEMVDSIKSLAINLKKRIEKGEDFAFLVKIFSDDPLSVLSNGIMPPVDWKKSLLSPIHNIIFNLPKDTVRIIEDIQSFYVVKIIDLQKVNVQPLEEVIDDIKSTLKNAYSYASLKDFEDEQSKLINENTIKWNENALKKLVEWSKIPNFYEGLYKDSIFHQLSQGKNFLILKASRYKVDLKTYLKLLDEVLILGRSYDVKEQDIKNFILEALKIQVIANKAHKLGLFEKIFNPYTRSQILIDEIAKIYDSEIIGKQLPEPNEYNLKMFYEMNKDSLYYQLAKVNVYVIFAEDSNKIIELKKKYSEGIPFEKLHNRVFVKRFIRQKDGSIKTDNHEDEPALSKIAFELNLNDVIGPIKYDSPDSTKKYAFIKCVSKREEKQLSYDDVKSNIKDDFIKFYREKVTREIIEKLKVKYDVKIYYENLKSELSSEGIILN